MCVCVCVCVYVCVCESKYIICKANSFALYPLWVYIYILSMRKCSGSQLIHPNVKIN